MVKKLALTVLLVIALGIPAFAGQTVEPLIKSTVFNSAKTSVTGSTYIGDADKVAFFVDYDKSQSTTSVSATITAEIADLDVPYAGNKTSPWLTASFYDFAGGPTTLKTWGSISTPSSYYFWFSPDTTIPQVRVKVQGNQLVGNNSALIDCYVVKVK